MFKYTNPNDFAIFESNFIFNEFLLFFICLTKMQTPDFLFFNYYKYMENENEDGKKKKNLPSMAHCQAIV
jgi:hypothetical protein